jgi:elongation factor P--(R)-beta-lysine ligase
MKWQPSCSLEMLAHRARILSEVRAFFAARDVLEVDTQILSRATVTDLALEGMALPYQGETFYLQTSPEYAMKRLLAAGAPDIYQLGKVFRSDEAGRYHNPEFTMLEWYRHGFTLDNLMDEVDELLALILKSAKSQRVTYQDLFIEHCQIDPHQASVEDLKQIALKKGIHVSESLESADKDTWLQLLFSHVIEPQLGFDSPVFVYEYPASQAALAITHIKNGVAVAARVEVFVNGLELANGYHELLDPQEQEKRFIQDNVLRTKQGLPQKPVDPYLLAAINQGLPPCSGIALGFDRLMMLALSCARIEEVIPFGFDRA